MTITIHDDVDQGSGEWLAMRCGILTASEMGLVLTPTLKIANNDKVRGHVWEKAAQQITKYVEPSFINEAMLRGHEDEIIARDLYNNEYAPVQEVGFITNDEWGFVIGCSPDGLVSDDGMIEIKSRVQKHQIKTIVQYREGNKTPPEFMLQVQTQMLVTGRKWSDLVSFSSGLPMASMRIFADVEIQEKIVLAARAFYQEVNKAVAVYRDAIGSGLRLLPTERIERME